MVVSNILIFMVYLVVAFWILAEHQRNQTMNVFCGLLSFFVIEVHKLIPALCMSRF